MKKKIPFNYTPYSYKAVVTEVTDGDTVTVDIDLGFHTQLKGEKVRLARINSPELKSKNPEEAKKAIESKAALMQLVLGRVIVLMTIKDREEKYGRYLGEIWIEETGGYVNVNDLQLANGHAKLYWK